MSNVPSAAARSVASERRLRLRRQEARLRLRLLADAALLGAHHASQAPRLPQPTRGGGDSDAEARSLRNELVAMRSLLSALEAKIEGLLRPATPTCGAVPASSVAEVQEVPLVAVGAAGDVVMAHE